MTDDTQPTPDALNDDVQALLDEIAHTVVPIRFSEWTDLQRKARIHDEIARIVTYQERPTTRIRRIVALFPEAN